MKGIAKVLVMFDKPVTSMFCDSKIGCQYVVQISVKDAKVARDVANFIDGLVVQFDPGHNGIFVEFGDNVLARCEPDWMSHEAEKHRWRGR